MIDSSRRVLVVFFPPSLTSSGPRRVVCASTSTVAAAARWIPQTWTRSVPFVLPPRSASLLIPACRNDSPSCPPAAGEEEGTRRPFPEALRREVEAVALVGRRQRRSGRRKPRDDARSCHKSSPPKQENDVRHMLDSPTVAGADTTCSESNCAREASEGGGNRGFAHAHGQGGTAEGTGHGGAAHRSAGSGTSRRSGRAGIDIRIRSRRTSAAQARRRTRAVGRLWYV